MRTFNAGPGRGKASAAFGSPPGPFPDGPKVEPGLAGRPSPAHTGATNPFHVGKPPHIRALLAATALLVLLAVPSATAARAPAASSTTCPDGYVLANLSWGQKCLHVGEFCKVGNVEYHAYGFDCPNGRLVDYAPFAPPTTTTTTTPAPAPAPTTTTVAQVTAPSITVLKPVRGKRPFPRTGQKAVALVRANTDTNREASPFKSELAWVAQWRGNKWWAVGLFSSPWGTRFVVDASVIGGRVYTYISYSARPSAKWVRATARRWQLPTLYTRLTPDAAIQLVEKDTISSRYTIL